jgi:undecaprenyl-diphosphatase
MAGGLLGGLAAFSLIAVDVVFNGPLRHTDDLVNDAVFNAQKAGFPMHLIGLVLTQIGASYTVTLCVLATSVWMWVKGQRPLAYWNAGIGIVVSLAVVALKEVFRRDRPPLLDALASYSFPSGHTLGATAGLGAVIILFTEVHVRLHHPKREKVLHIWFNALAIWVTLAVLCGIGRVFVQAHWMSDVMASWSLGLALVSGILFALSRQQPAGEPGPKVPEAPPETSPAKARGKRKAKA